MNRVARAVGGQIVHRTEELKESDVGTECGLFEVGNEKFVQIFYVTCTCLIRASFIWTESLTLNLNMDISTSYLFKLNANLVWTIINDIPLSDQKVR